MSPFFCTLRFSPFFPKLLLRFQLQCELLQMPLSFHFSKCGSREHTFDYPKPHCVVIYYFGNRGWWVAFLDSRIFNQYYSQFKPFTIRKWYRICSQRYCNSKSFISKSNKIASKSIQSVTYEMRSIILPICLNEIVFDLWFLLCQLKIHLNRIVRYSKTVCCCFAQLAAHESWHW